MKKNKTWIAVTAHNSSAEHHHAARNTYDEAVDVIHKHFLNYGFEIKDGKPIDTDDPDGEQSLSDVFMHKGKVASFTHADGDGPIGYITESE